MVVSADSRFPSAGSGQALTGLSARFGMTRVLWRGAGLLKSCPDNESGLTSGAEARLFLVTLTQAWKACSTLDLEAAALLKSWPSRW